MPWALDFSSKGARTGSGLFGIDIAALLSPQPVSSSKVWPSSQLAQSRDSGAAGPEKSIRGPEGRNRNACRHDRQHLEKLAHRLRAGKPLDLVRDFFTQGFAGLGTELAGTLQQPQTEQEGALRGRARVEALRAGGCDQGGKIDMGGEVGFARTGKNVFVPVFAQGLQRVADARPQIAVVDEQACAAVLADTLGDARHQRRTSRRKLDDGARRRVDGIAGQKRRIERGGA